MTSADFLSKAITGMEKVIEWVATMIISVMVVNILLGVFSRFVLHLGIPFTEELGRYLMIWAGYLGCVLALKEDSHISITAVVDLFPPAGRVIRFIARLVVSVFLAVIVVTSFTHLRGLKIQKSSAMEIPMVIPYLAVTVGAFLMAIVNTIRLLGGYPAMEAPPEAK